MIREMTQEMTLPVFLYVHKLIDQLAWSTNINPRLYYKI